VGHAAVIGNLSGIFVQDPTSSDPSDTTITHSNIYGNGTGTEVNEPPNNCGLRTFPAITATNNFWGAATGPGPDPADAICSPLGEPVTFTPFATEEFEIPRQARR
jgi:hypothetical protein